MALVQVLLPVFNSEQFLAECLDSLLAQTMLGFQIIVLDDGSTDNTGEILKAYAKEHDAIILHRNAENLGIIESRNKLFQLADAEYLAIADSDDVYLPNRLKKQYEFLKEHEHIAAVSGGYRALQESGYTNEFIPPHESEIIRDYLTLDNVFPNPAAMIRKSVIDAKQLKFDCDYRGAADYLFWYNLSREHELYNIPEVLFCYRRHATQESTANSPRQIRSHLKVVNKFLGSVGLFLPEQAICCIAWPAQYFDKLSQKEANEVVSQIAETIDMLEVVDKQNMSGIAKLWDIRLRSFCYRRGLSGFMHYSIHRGFSALVRGRRWGFSFLISSLKSSLL